MGTGIITKAQPVVRGMGESTGYTEPAIGQKILGTVDGREKKSARALGVSIGDDAVLGRDSTRQAFLHDASYEAARALHFFFPSPIVKTEKATAKREKLPRRHYQ